MLRTPQRDHTAFTFSTVCLAALLAASSAPTPLYVLYQKSWGFSPTVLSIVFSVYAIALLVALLTTARVSDHLGRRPVAIVALLAEAAAMGMFFIADSVPTLIAARVLQGLATGVATAVLGAALVELEPRSRPGAAALANSLAPVGGMALGVLASTFLVRTVHDPATVVFASLMAVFAVLAGLAVLLPGGVERRPGVLRSLRPHLAVPALVRPDLWRVLPLLVAGWALGGFYSSFGPSLAPLVTDADPHVTGGLVFAALTLSATLAVTILYRQAARTALLVGGIALAAGAATTLLALDAASVTTLFIGTALSGAGFGAVTQGALRVLLPRARPEERSGVLATYYVVSYLAMSIPAVLAGLLATSFGLPSAARAYGVLILVLVLASLASLAGQHHRPLPRPHPTT